MDNRYNWIFFQEYYKINDIDSEMPEQSPGGGEYGYSNRHAHADLRHSDNTFGTVSLTR